jgi:hypothetical protein
MPNPDITEVIRTYILTNTDLAGVHVGEYVPEGVTSNYVWLIRSGENPTDELNNYHDIDSITLDIECVSDDIDSCRNITKEVKFWLRQYELHSVSFEDDYGNWRTLHGFMVDDHDDTYISKALQNDDAYHVGALDVTVLYGGICIDDDGGNGHGPGPGPGNCPGPGGE